MTALFESLLRGNFRCGRMPGSRAPHQMARRGRLRHTLAKPRMDCRGAAIWNL